MKLKESEVKSYLDKYIVEFPFFLVRFKSFLNIFADQVVVFLFYIFKPTPLPWNVISPPGKSRESFHGILGGGGKLLLLEIIFKKKKRETTLGSPRNQNQE